MFFRGSDLGADKMKHPLIFPWKNIILTQRYAVQKNVDSLKPENIKSVLGAIKSSNLVHRPEDGFNDQAKRLDHKLVV